MPYLRYNHPVKLLKVRNKDNKHLIGKVGILLAVIPTHFDGSSVIEVGFELAICGHIIYTRYGYFEPTDATPDGELSDCL